MFGGAAAAYVCPLPAAPVEVAKPVLTTTELIGMSFDPMRYMGEWRWINIAPTATINNEVLDRIYERLTQES